MNQDDFAITVLGPPDSPTTVPVAISQDAGYREHNYHSPYGSPVSPGYLSLADGYQGYSTPESSYEPLNLQMSDFSGAHSSPTHASFAGTYGGSSPNSPVPSSPNALSAVSQSFNGISLNDPPSPHQDEHRLSPSPAEGGYIDQAFYDDSKHSLIFGEEGLYIRPGSRPSSALSTRSALLPPRIAIPASTSYSAPASRGTDHYPVEGTDFMSSIVNMEALSKLFDDEFVPGDGSCEHLNPEGHSDLHLGVNDYNLPENTYSESFQHSPSVSPAVSVAGSSPISSGFAIDGHIARESYQKEEEFSPHHPSTPRSSWNSPDSRTGALSSDTESTSSLAYSPAHYSADSSSSSQTMYMYSNPMEGGGQRRRGHSVGSADGHAGHPSCRGRTHTRMLSSPSNSRRPSPYPQSRSPVSPSSGDLLSVPQREFGFPPDSIRRRHSFTQVDRARSATLLSPDSPSEVSHFSRASPDALHTGEQAAFSVKQPASRKIASQAGIKASEARRTKQARFHCDYCSQSFTTNHNLKNHLNVHLGVKPFQCPGCQRASTTQSVHARHLKTCKALESPSNSHMIAMP